MPRIRTILLLLVAAVQVACQPRDTGIDGRWIAIPGSKDFGSIEFLPDKSAHLRDVKSWEVGGRWAMLPDGRLKLEAVVLGTTMIALGSIRGDSLFLNWEATRTFSFEIVQ